MDNSIFTDNMQYGMLGIMNEYKLPRAYLSYSAFALWQKDKDAYRRRYYLNEKPHESAETIFGKKVHEMFEKDDSIIGSETRIEVELVPGLKLLGYIDSFDESNLSFIDFKTGHLSPDGKSPWSKLKVQKHKQLVFYSLLILIKYKKFNPVSKLIWYETRFKTIKYKGHTFNPKNKSMELTGKVEEFTRKTFKYEIENLKKEIIKVAKEISEDYEKFCNK